jgi:translation initiation factor IF-3
MFRGREMAHPERGEMILNRLAEDLGELAVIEQRPQQDGRNMTMMLAPAKAAIEGEAPVTQPQNENSAPKKEKAPRAAPQQRPAGSAQPAEIQPDQI